MVKSSFHGIIIGILLCAGLALFYVHQEVEIVKTGFRINKHADELSLLLDQHRSLVYNLSRLESPKRIEETLSTNEIKLCMPNIGDVRRFEKITLAEADRAGTSGKKSFLARFFDRFSAKAEAKVVK